MDPIQAFLMLDWINREPGVAFKFMTEEYHSSPSFRLKKADISKLDDVITTLGGNPDKDPHVDETALSDESDIIL